MVNGLNGLYVDHFVPASGTGRDIGIGLCNIIINTESVDTTVAVNAGKHNFHSKSTINKTNIEFINLKEIFY